MKKANNPEVKVYDPETQKFKEIKEYRNIDYNIEYNLEEIKKLFKHYSEEELLEFIKKNKKLGQITEVRSGIYRFDKIYGDEN